MLILQGVKRSQLPSLHWCRDEGTPRGNGVFSGLASRPQMRCQARRCRSSCSAPSASCSSSDPPPRRPPLAPPRAALRRQGRGESWAPCRATPQNFGDLARNATPRSAGVHHCVRPPAGKHRMRIRSVRSSASCSVFLPTVRSSAHRAPPGFVLPSAAPARRPEHTGLRPAPAMEVRSSEKSHCAQPRVQVTCSRA